MANEDRIVDCHAHIIDPARFPFTGTKGYQPHPDERGTREECCAVLDRHGVSHAVLVQLSGYGTNNGAILDAVKDIGVSGQKRATHRTRGTVASRQARVKYFAGV